MRILTFDIEEWFHLLDNDSTRSVTQWESFECRIHENSFRIFDMLREKKQKATLFCLGWVAEKYPEILREASALGLELGSHTHTHQLAYEQSPGEFSEDLHRSVETIQQVTGTRVRSFRVPGFSLTQHNTWVFDALAKHGIEMDSSVFPAWRMHGGFRMFDAAKPVLVKTMYGLLHEFPINTYDIFGKRIVFSGGGYFRLTPYQVLRYLVRRSPYVMTYFHPRDFDHRQPMVPGLSPLRRVRSYYGLRGAFEKLERLLNEFEFIDLTTARNRIDWSSVNTIDVTEAV